MKRVALIPMLLGSTRVKDKNLLFVNGRLLVDYVIDACQEAGIFDEIYINSEHEIFKKIAEARGVRFYPRDPAKGGSACQMKNKSSQCSGNRCQTHDHFIYDFMKNTDAEFVYLVHTTSPLMTGESIRKFVQKIENEGFDSMFSVIEDFTESYYDGKPVNFNPAVKVPTQSLKPMQRITWALTGWKKKSFMQSYERNSKEDSGPTWCGKVGFCPMDKIEGLDIDNWDDLYLTEAYLFQRHTFKNRPTVYYSDKVTRMDCNLERIMTQDGVGRFEGKSYNQPIINVSEIKKKMGKPPWCYLLIYSDTDQSCLIAQPKEDGCREHFHTTRDEWWYILEGEFDWHVNGKVVHAKANDVVFLRKGTPHKISCVSKEGGIRLAMGGRDMAHIYL